MFDIGAAELLVILIVAVVVIGPKDLPLAMRVAGRWIGKMRRMSAHFRSGIDAMVREAELDDMEKKWKAQNEEIMRRSAALTEAEAGAPVMTGPPPVETASVDSQPLDAPLMETGPVETAPVETPTFDPAPLARPVTITVGNPSSDFDQPATNEPILPAKPHLSSDDV